MNSKLRSIYIIAPFLIIFCSISYMILHAAKAAPELKTFGLLVILFTAMIVLLSIGVLIRRAESIKYEKLFPFLALGFGLLFLTVITPISVPDEATHYTASYIISNKILMKPNPEEANAADFEFIDNVNNRKKYNGSFLREVLSSAISLYIETLRVSAINEMKDTNDREEMSFDSILDECSYEEGSVADVIKNFRFEPMNFDYSSPINTAMSIRKYFDLKLKKL